MKTITLLLVIGTSLTIGPLCAAEADGFEFANRPLLKVIADLERSGYHFVYSKSLVRSTTVISISTDGDPTIERLRKALGDISLSLSKADNGTYFIVPTERTSQPLAGRITDAQSGEPLSGVRIELENQVVFSDSNGRFQLPDQLPVPIPDNSVLPVPISGPISVSLDGYRARLVATSESLADMLEIPLDPHADIEEVVVISSRYALKKSTGLSLYGLDSTDFDSLPELGDDALRAAVHLPGTATIGLSAKPYIRGGLQDETLVLFNNVELLEPFHLKDFQSVFSSFNPALIKTIDVYTGGFPARYGDRMSGVMDIDPTDEYSGLGAELGLSFLTSSAAAYGTTHEGRGEWAFSGRRGNLDIVTDAVNSSVGDPSYSDWFGSYSWALTPSTELEFGTIVYDDDIQFKDLDDDDVTGELANSRYRNAYGWVQLHNDWTPHRSSSTLLSFGSIRHDRDGFISDPDPDEGSSTLDDERDFKVWSLAHQHYYEHSDRLNFEFGGRLNYQKGRYDTHAVIERGELAEFIGIQTSELRDIQVRPEGAGGGVYASTRVRPSAWMTLEVGLRWDFQDYGEKSEHQLSPRISSRFDVGKNTQIRVSAGRFYQPEAIHELQAADGVSRFQKPQYADHFIAGINHEFGDSGFSSRIETFYKRFRDPKRRFENVFNSLVLIPELMSDRVEVAPEKARARGIEATLRYNPGDELNLWLSYTRASADDRIDGDWRPRSWDQQHSISSGVIWHRGPWSVSGTVLWHSGWQTTLLPATIVEDEQPDLRRNDDQLPEFISVDFRVSHMWEWSQQSLTLFLEVTNALNRDNVGAYEYELEEDDENGGFTVIAEEETLLPLVPSLGLLWRFN